MVVLVAFVAALASLYYFGFYTIGFFVAGFAALNGILAAFKAVRDPKWYVRRRAAELGEDSYTSLFGPSDEQVKADITNLLLAKLLWTVPLVVTATIFAYAAWFR
jgi:hypothetical protein